MKLENLQKIECFPSSIWDISFSLRKMPCAIMLSISDKTLGLYLLSWMSFFGFSLFTTLSNETPGNSLVLEESMAFASRLSSDDTVWSTLAMCMQDAYLFLIPVVPCVAVIVVQLHLNTCLGHPLELCGTEIQTILHRIVVDMMDWLYLFFNLCRI